MNLAGNSPIVLSLRPNEVCITQIGSTVSSLKPQLLGCDHCVCVPACVCVCKREALVYFRMVLILDPVILHNFLLHNTVYMTSHLDYKL